jgi:hypothetical protein
MVRNLFPDRNFHPADSDISFFCYTPCKEGAIVCVYDFPTGALLDDPGAEVGPPQGTLADTIPAGIMQQEVIEFDNTRMSMDMSDDEVILVGSKVGVYKKGWFVTRCIAAAADPVLKSKPAYYDINGDFTTAAGSPCVGTFQSNRDANGYARVFIDIPTYGRKAGL